MVKQDPYNNKEMYFVWKERENQLLKERMKALEKQLERVVSLVEKVEALSKSCT